MLFVNNNDHDMKYFIILKIEICNFSLLVLAYETWWAIFFIRIYFLTFAETIYVRIYEERMDLMRVALVGAPGTPYHDGLFFFDIFLPPEYPQEPPVSSLELHMAL